MVFLFGADAAKREVTEFELGVNFDDPYVIDVACGEECKVFISRKELKQSVSQAFDESQWEKHNPHVTLTLEGESTTNTDNVTQKIKRRKHKSADGEKPEKKKKASSEDSGQVSLIE